MRVHDGRARLSASDLANHLACRHLTALNLQCAEGERERSRWRDAEVQALAKRGAAHEAAYLGHLEGQGLEVVRLDGGVDDAAFVRTVEAMREGVAVIAQATLISGRWLGIADVLRRVEARSELGDWSYEVVDTKLARETRGGTVLQLCLYSEIVGEAQGRLPESMHVVAPGRDFEPETFRVLDHLAASASHRSRHAVVRELAARPPPPPGRPGGGAVHDVGHVTEPMPMPRPRNRRRPPLKLGEDLADRLANGPLSIEEAVDVCRQIAEGLETAHEAGVVHRDLKPANVRVTPGGVVKVLDFGLAKPMIERSSKSSMVAKPDSFLMTEEGRVLGTPTYMSPEQARGRPIDRRTDVWAFGCVLFECLTGKRAFGGDSTPDVLVAIVGEEPDWSAPQEHACERAAAHAPLPHEGSAQPPA